MRAEGITRSDRGADVARRTCSAIVIVLLAAGTALSAPSRPSSVTAIGKTIQVREDFAREPGKFRVFFEYGTQTWKTGGGTTFEGDYQTTKTPLHAAGGA